ncbi:MAG: HIRAN domain-containing protein [Bacillota bacterium]
MKERYITITGVQHYYGMKPLAVGRVLRCTKEPENCYDDEAIRAELPFIGKVGYVANSPHTCANGTMSAGRIYDSVENVFFARVMFTTQTKVIARVLDGDPAELIEAFVAQASGFCAGTNGEGL